MIFGLTGREDRDLARAKIVDLGDSNYRQAVANSNNGQSLSPPRYLPGWGPYFPESLVGSKLEQAWPDGHMKRSTEMTAFVPVEEVIAFYRAAVAASGIAAREGSWPRGVCFIVPGGPIVNGDAVLISDGSWTNSDGSRRYKVSITVQQGFGPGDPRW